MAHVVTGRCVDCRYTDCCAVCPTDSFFQIDGPAMLVIDPNVCADCAACAPECPVWAIYPEDEVPAPYKEWIARNAELAPKGKVLKERTSALPGAVPIGTIHEREKAKGWKIADPSAVAGMEPPVPKAAPAPAPAPAAKAPASAPPAAPPPKPEPKAEAKPVVPPPAAAGPAASETPKVPAPAAPKALQGTAPAGIPPAAKKEPPKDAAKAEAAPSEQPAAAPAAEAPPPPAGPLDLGRGARIRLDGRAATVREIRRGWGKELQDAKLLFEGEKSPVWHGYGSLEFAWKKGRLQVLEAGRKAGFLGRLLGR